MNNPYVDPIGEQPAIPVSVAFRRGWRKFVRTILQLIVGGGLTALVDAVANLSPRWTAVILGAWTAILAGAQNTLETAAKIPVVLPTPPEAQPPP